MSLAVVLFVGLMALIVSGVLLMGFISAVMRVRKLQAAIREHRDARGNDRCWLDDEKLYRILSDHEPFTTLPTKERFLANCERFHANRQHPYHLQLFYGDHPGGATPERPKPRLHGPNKWDF